MLTPTQKGAIAEAVIAAEAIKAGVRVWRPAVEGGRADLVFEIGNRFLRVQWKSANLRRGVIVVPLRTHRRGPSGHVQTSYGATEVDVFAVYCPDTRSCYLLPIQDAGRRGNVYLRLAQARNNQEIAITYAADYEFHGAIAQLGERLTGSQEVGGSNPPSSIEEAA